MNKITIAVIVVIVLGFGGLITYTALNNNQHEAIDYTQYDAAKIIPADDNNGNIADHVRGKEDSPVVLVEYADFQCPGCASAIKTVNSIYKSYGDRVAFVFRHFPLNGHPNARSAAAASEAAAKQGYFWEMADTLYSNRASWVDETGSSRTEQYVELFAGIAPNGNIEQFRTDMNDEMVAKHISFDYDLGRNVSDVSATPSFYVNGKNVYIMDAKSQDELKQLVEDELNAALKENGMETGPAKTSLTK